MTHHHFETKQPSISPLAGYHIDITVLVLRRWETKRPAAAQDKQN